MYADQSENATPGFMDDECRITGTNGQKFTNHRAQWESTCRYCCKADANASGTGTYNQCNGPGGTASPIKTACTDASCATYFTGGAPQFGSYSISNIPAFLDDQLHHTRVHPGEGRNSLPEDKFIQRKNKAGDQLIEQADQLSMEETDFHNNRQTLTETPLSG